MIHAKAVILAAGLGTRLRPITDRTPKCLAPIAGRPLLDFWFDLLGDAGIRDVLINTHTFRDQMQRYIQARTANGCRTVIEGYEPQLLGSAGTIAAQPGFGDDSDVVVLIYADNLSDVNLKTLIEYHCSHDDPVTMLLFRADNPAACGIAELDRNGRVITFEEKPQAPKSNLANAGVYVVDAAAYREIAAMQVDDFGFDVLPSFVGRMRGWEWTGYHRDIGTVAAYEAAQKDAVLLLAARGIQPNGKQAAVFFDRDGTLIESVHYLGDPGEVRTLPGAATALWKLRSAGFRCVVVTNQSAIGRGLVSEEQFRAVNDAMCRQLAEQGAVVDALYFCPLVPSNGDRTTVEQWDRKPGPGMLLQAAEKLKLDLSRSWMVGDMVSDVLAGHNAGCAGSILIGKKDKDEVDSGVLVKTSTFGAGDLGEAAELILSQTVTAHHSRTVEREV